MHVGQIRIDRVTYEPRKSCAENIRGVARLKDGSTMGGVLDGIRERKKFGIVVELGPENGPDHTRNKSHGARTQDAHPARTAAERTIMVDPEILAGQAAGLMDEYFQKQIRPRPGRMNSQSPGRTSS